MDTKIQRDTKQRRMILDAVMSRRDHPTADDVYLDVHQQDAHISKGTVYRNLKLLADNGELTRVVSSGADRFDRKLEKHYHFLCTHCRRVTDVPLDYLSEYDTLAAKETGFEITRHRTVFEGICADCLRQPKDM